MMTMSLFSSGWSPLNINSNNGRSSSGRRRRSSRASAELFKLPLIPFVKKLSKTIVVAGYPTRPKHFFVLKDDTCSSRK